MLAIIVTYNLYNVNLNDNHNIIRICVKKNRNFSANDEKCTKYSHYTKVINSVAITIEDRIHRMLYEKYTDIKYFSVSCL